MAESSPHFPGRAPIDAYGDDGFRFSGMSHQGSLLCLPSGIYGWRPDSLADVTADDAARIISERSEIGFLLLGTGGQFSRPPAPFSEELRAANISLELMDTGAACRTYNVLLAEGRPVAAALIRVP